MRSSDVGVRHEAAYGLGVKLAETDGDVIPAAIEELRACLDRETEPSVDALILEAFGLARYTTEIQMDEAEALLVREAHGPVERVLGAVRGLEALLRRSPQRSVADATRVRLRELAFYGKGFSEGQIDDPDARIRRLALMALQSARDTDIDTLQRAIGDADWQVRRLVATRLNLGNPALAQLAATLVHDPAFQVRYDVVAALGRTASQTGDCAPLLARLEDPSPVVVMRAMDALPATCTEMEPVVAALAAFADKFDRPDGETTWHVPARAVSALARLQPAESRARVAALRRHDVWQVRATAAAAAARTGDTELLIELSADQEPNVRTAALGSLATLKSPAVFERAIAALRDGQDYQLLRAAATHLRGVPEELRGEATSTLLTALATLTAAADDTSRDPRVAILERLAETLAPERSSDVQAYLGDYDDVVAETAKKTFERLIGAEVDPPADRLRRYPYQPAEAALSALPREATIELEDGIVTLDLLIDVAPVTVARFTALVGQGFYRNRTFHRVVPNFVVQGGSPGANEYVGTSRYMRDEVGPQARHVRGAVGISTRGRDTGDGQIFIDLVDLPRLDRDYTVFAYVKAGMEHVDRLLEGATIINISVR
jgi:cyclophilin family peptidyl-prolyl cis-trans isomerase